MVYESNITTYLRRHQYETQAPGAANTAAFSVYLPDYVNVWERIFGGQGWEHDASKEVLWSATDDTHTTNDTYREADSEEEGYLDDDSSSEVDEIDWIRSMGDDAPSFMQRVVKAFDKHIVTGKIDYWSVEDVGVGETVTEQPSDADGNLLSTLEELDTGEDWEGSS